MKEDTPSDTKLETLAREILEFSRNTLAVNLRFMDTALFLPDLLPARTAHRTAAQAGAGQAAPATRPAETPPPAVPHSVQRSAPVSAGLEAARPEEETVPHSARRPARPTDRTAAQAASICTDGAGIYYDPAYVVRSCKKEKESIARAYLHMILHCVFHHPFKGAQIERRCWDLACDIAVENVINSLELPAVRTARADRQELITGMLADDVGALTAEKIYSRFKRKRPDPAWMEEMEELFLSDDHSPWYTPNEANVRGRSASPDGGQKKERAHEGTYGDSASPDGGQKKTHEGAYGDDIRKRWSDAAARMQADLESFSKKRGDKAGSLMQSLKGVTREHYDYTAFLKRFASAGEAMKVNDEEFDYIFYTYGLKLYDNMPLVEPLEYREVRRIKEFVIAIDTSGSVSGELLKRFITKTCGILMQQENFFTKINLHIIQCDAAIQDDARITCRKELEDYVRSVKVKGFGGTDFRPVFEYVDDLRGKGELGDMKGLIYFTDGNGIFPERPPEYDAAFVFVDEDYAAHKVPVWAIKLVLLPEEI